MYVSAPCRVVIFVFKMTYNLENEIIIGRNVFVSNERMSSRDLKYFIKT